MTSTQTTQLAVERQSFKSIHKSCLCTKYGEFWLVRQLINDIWSIFWLRVRMIPRFWFDGIRQAATRLYWSVSCDLHRLTVKLLFIQWSIILGCVSPDSLIGVSSSACFNECRLNLGWGCYLDFSWHRTFLELFYSRASIYTVHRQPREKMG